MMRLKIVAFLLLAVCLLPAGTHDYVAASPRALADDEDGDDGEEATQPAKEAKPGLHLEFSLNRPEGGRYRRPYVAVWLEDAENYPVKTGLLWLQKDQPGPRWHRDLTRWYRNDRLRKVAERTDLIDGISGATRGPGDYHAFFDGTDNSGQMLKPGKYTLYVEVAREHGTYQLLRHEVTLGGEGFTELSLPGNVELSNIRLSYILAAESVQ